VTYRIIFAAFFLLALAVPILLLPHEPNVRLAVVLLMWISFGLGQWAQASKAGR